MPRRCSIKDCKSKGEKACFHEIPTSIKRQEKWKKALKPFLDDQIDDKTLICSKHFKKSDYIPSLSGSKPLLCKSAVPSVFPSAMPKKQPEVVVVRPRHQSRRAASKEALKQMQILLEDENDTVEIPDDDEVIPFPVVVAPPKKKYKLTHRKSSDGNDREVLVLKSITPNITNHYVENNLELECWVEELEPCQKERNKKLEEEEAALQSKLDELIKACNGEVVYKGELTTIIEVSEHIQKTIQAVQASISKPPIVLNNTVASPQTGYQLVMDPRLGLIVGAVPPANQTPSKQAKIQVASNLQGPVSPNPSQATSPGGSRRSRTKKPTPAGQQTPPTPAARGVPALRTTTSTRTVPVATPIRSTPSIATRSLLHSKQGNKRTAPQPSPAAPPATRSRRDPVANVRPTETSVEGGLTTGTKPKAIVDLTSDDGRPLPDSREISFNKLQGKTFPSLVVVARPHLRVADVNSDRVKLDAKVKSVLMYAPTKFTEWLIQQGLVKSEQKCTIHTTTQLKLGMYSDVSKFPYSGGYVWISECCPQRFVSVFSGSVFEGSPHPPLVILKILYHWSCQTNIQNVTQWVKVDNLYVKGMYTWLRSICTVALQTHIRQLGGPQTKVEVGVISLGTTSQDGNSRQVKVEVLGILETSTKLIRLRAIEPLADGDRNYKKRFSKILEPLGQWVHPSSIIVTDLTVDKATLHQMGFSTVVQTTSVDANNSNRTIMEYLRRIVPRMFQNTLSLLSRQIIQQFLDELVWREWFGTTSMQAFDNLIAHLAEQTRFESNQSLIVKLNRVALNPFKNWGVASTSTTTAIPAAAPSIAPKTADTTATKKRKRKEPEPPKPSSSPAPEVNRPPKSNSPDVPEQMVPLEHYYYGTIDNYPPKTNVILNMKCPFCKEMFNNNIVLMNHLFKHAHNVSLDGQMCRYCLTSVPTANDLLKHISTAHPSETKHDNGFVCLICETQYMNPFVLGKHMSKEHCPSELPYQCGTCGYRCSNHKQAIDHFYKQHDNGPTIQCPFCLKSTTVFSSSRNIAQNMHYFIQHLQKHQRKQYARRCGKCNLWFVQKDILKEHQTKMHASQRGKTGLLNWVAPRNGVMVPKSKMDKYPCDAEGINFSTLFFNLTKTLACKECDGPMDSPKHFPSFESCQNPNCQYSTCCSNAMQEHNAKCNKNTPPILTDEKLPYEMFCICGYSSQDGNQMAKHLTVCERKSAYPSLSDAKSASVTHSMLDVLGLVRKPEETEKKQTAVSRTIKKGTATKFEPETITLDEDDTTENVAKKKLKKDEIKIDEDQEEDTEEIRSSMDVDTLEKTADEESDGIPKGTKELGISDDVNKETDKIHKESDTIDTGESIDKETDLTGNETEKEIENREPKDVNPVSKKDGNFEEVGDINVSMAEQAPTSVDSADVLNIEPNQQSQDSFGTAASPLKLEDEEDSEEKDKENDLHTEKPASEIVDEEEKNQEEDDKSSKETDVDDAMETEDNKLIKGGEVESSSDAGVEKTDSTEINKRKSEEPSDERQSEEPSSEMPFEDPFAERHPENISDEKQYEEPSNDKHSEEPSNDKQSVEPFDEKQSEELSDERPFEDPFEESQLKNPNEKHPEEPSYDSIESSTTKSEENEAEKDSEISQEFETVNKSREEDNIQNLEDQIDTPTELENVSISDGYSDTNKETVPPDETPNDQFLNVISNFGTEVSQELEPDAPIRENLGEGLSDQFEDIMSKLASRSRKGLEDDESKTQGVTADSSNEFENISDRDENVSRLPEVSSPVGDIPSTSGVYDDVSESSDNTASKYLEEPEVALNLGETEQAGDMEVDQIDNQKRVPEGMDYEDISNTGLDTLTSMDTD